MCLEYACVHIITSPTLCDIVIFFFVDLLLSFTQMEIRYAGPIMNVH